MARRSRSAPQTKSRRIRASSRRISEARDCGRARRRLNSMLQLENLHVYYGGIHALKVISLVVNKGEVVTLIGAKGAGKSTTLRTVTGLVEPRYGRIVFEGEDITGVAAHKLGSRGISM